MQDTHLVEGRLAALKIMHHVLPALRVGRDAPHAQQRLPCLRAAGAIAGAPGERPCIQPARACQCLYTIQGQFHIVRW